MNHPVTPEDRYYAALERAKEFALEAARQEYDVCPECGSARYEVAFHGDWAEVTCFACGAEIAEVFMAAERNEAAIRY